MTTSNFRYGVGRLVTDRYEFGDHVDGYNLRHKAGSIDLNPALTIGGVSQTTVQGALTAALPYFTTPALPDATASVKGAIQLAGDISGRASSITVSALRGKAIASTSPTLNYVLTWNGSAWEPLASQGSFTADGDLSGDNISQTVVSITGYLDVVAVDCNIQYTERLTPTITQIDTDVTDANDMTITAQSTTAVGYLGGDLILSGGEGGEYSVMIHTKPAAGVQLQMAKSDDTLVHLVEPTLGNRVLALVSHDPITDTEMPADTGNKVIYIKDAVTAPSTGSPVGGVILYSSAGTLNIKQEDGTDFQVGTLLNPYTWGDVGSSSYVYNYRKKTSVGAAVSSSSVIFGGYRLPTGSSAIVEVDAIGVIDDGYATQSIHYKLMSAFRKDGYGVLNDGMTPHGAQEIYEQNDLDPNDWTAPVIESASNKIYIYNGYSDTYDTIWFVTVKITVCSIT